MKPWFEKEIVEGDIIKFPEPQAKVVQMPNVQEYPDFITGVQDLQAKQKDGAISQESYDKLYTDLIHRFMKKESFENPWFIRESGSKRFLAGDELFKKGREYRLDQFINDIQNGVQFTGLKKGEPKPFPVTIDPKEVPNVQRWITAGNPAQPLTLKTSQGNLTIGKTTNKPFELLKTNAYGGQQANFSGKEGGKESYKIKPSDIGIVDKEIPASQLGQTIIKALTPIATSDPAAKEALAVAQRILKGNPKIDLKYLSGHKGSLEALRDYAGEYLGILMVVQKLANFPNDAPFYKHLDVSGFNQLNIFFPSSTNNPLSDSVGTVAGFKNPKTGFKIMISSKGGKSGVGAAAAMDGFKIPDELKKNPEYKEEVEFMEAHEQADQYAYPFALMDVINTYAPKSIADQGLLKFLPFKTKLRTIPRGNKQAKDAEKDKNMIALFKYLESKGFYSKRGTGTKEVFSRIHWALNNMIKICVNQNNALPDIEPMFREFLQQNFIKVGSKITKDGNFETKVLWPNKELATGNVSFYNKNEPKAVNMKAAIKIF